MLAAPSSRREHLIKMCLIGQNMVAALVSGSLINPSTSSWIIKLLSTQRMESDICSLWDMSDMSSSTRIECHKEALISVRSFLSTHWPIILINSFTISGDMYSLLRSLVMTLFSLKQKELVEISFKWLYILMVSMNNGSPCRVRYFME